MQILIKKSVLGTLACTLAGLMNLSAYATEMDAPAAQQPLPPLAQSTLPVRVHPSLLQSLGTSVIDPIITGPVPVKK
ncbi:hypothetical protein [Paenochrobactrum glaciei]|uniref:Uncharacterized protein n=1 Tax=Paenochrobactrum glaciei TaxID=486407 RepID=A0ABN1G0V0_9HYPH